MRPLIAAILLISTACRNDPDEDEDGIPEWADCNDVDAAIGPDQTEICNDIDDNCDGVIDNDASDAMMFYADGDGDGAGYLGSGELACAAPPGFITDSTDCDDTDPTVHPLASEDDCTDPKDYNCDGSVGYADADGDGFPACEDCDDAAAAVSPNATEICDGIDNDCNGEVDEDGAVGGSMWYLDKDNDGYGDPAVAVSACSAPTGNVADNSDCDDLDVAVNPGASELCNDADDDCDGNVDDNPTDASTWYADVDGDGSGGATTTVEACDQPSGHQASSDDCDDLDANSYPSATELCDGVDNDCDGSLPADEADGDSDGFMGCNADCDEGDGAIFPGAAELCNGVDEDCNGVADDDAVDESLYYWDADGDGHGYAYGAVPFCSPPAGYVALNDDCDDLNEDRSPTNAEVPGNGLDENCDEVVIPWTVYGVDRYTGELWAIDYDTGEVFWMTTGLGEMIDVVVAPDGGLYVSAYGAGELVHLDWDGSNPTTVASGFPDIHGLWYDHSTDTVLLTTYDTIAEYDPADGSTTTLASGLSTEAIHTVRFEGDSTLWTTFRVEQELRSYDPASATWTTEGSFPDAPNIIVPSATGGFWVSSGTDERLMHFDRDGGRSVYDVNETISGICDSPVGGGDLVFGDFSGGLVSIDVNTGSQDYFSGSVGDVWGCATNAVLDVDGDGYNQRAYGGADCDDNDADINPSITDDFGDSVDQNCDFSDGTDADGDGWSADDTTPGCVDPDDSDATIGATNCGLVITVEGHPDVTVDCDPGDYSCQAHGVCEEVTGFTCVHQNYDCATGSQGSWYPLDGVSGSSSFNFAYAYDLYSGDYGNICACTSSQMTRYGLAMNHRNCGWGLWIRVP